MHFGQRLAVLPELALFALIVAGHEVGWLPVSSTPFLLLLVWVSLAARKLSWGSIGLRLPANPGKAVVLGSLAGVGLQLWGQLVQEPFFDWLTGQSQDLSQFAGLRGNVGFLVVMLILNWLLAAFGEETAYRGYLIHRFKDLFGSTRIGWGLALACSSLTFGVAHGWQGISGMLDATVMGVLYGALYLASGRNLLVPAMAHGVNNTIGLFLLFLGFGLD